MITHEINRPAKVYEPPRQGVIHNIREIARAAVSMGQVRDGEPPPHLMHWNTQWPRSDIKWSAGKPYLEKVAYTIWLEDIVRKKLPKGAFVTLVYSVEGDGRIPSPLFVVDDLQEVCWMCPIDTTHDEPRCVATRTYSPVYNGPQVWYPPKLLRPLSEKEIAIVHLRDKETKERREHEKRNETYAG